MVALAIVALGRRCNHPSLLLPAGQTAPEDAEEDVGELAAVVKPLFPPGFAGQPEHSGGQERLSFKKVLTNVCHWAACVFALPAAPSCETACAGASMQASSTHACTKQVMLSTTGSPAARAGSHRARAHGARTGKLAALAALLAGILDGERLRCVVASSSTAALDLVAALCARRGWATVRIDGGTEPGRRQEVVDGFNLYNRGQARLAAEQRHCAGHDRR